MSSKSSKIPGERSIGNVSNLRSQEIKDILKIAGVPFDDHAIKARLLAILALSRLGYLKKGEVADSSLVTTIADFCNVSVKKLVSKLEYRGLDTKGTRWKHVEVLIRAEYVFFLASASPFIPSTLTCASSCMLRSVCSI